MRASFEFGFALEVQDSAAVTGLLADNIDSID
jgi:hypothetical protein